MIAGTDLILSMTDEILRCLEKSIEKKRGGLVRVITGWDMGVAERQYYQRHRKG